jgi:hypothetical protein
LHWLVTGIITLLIFLVAAFDDKWLPPFAWPFRRKRTEVQSQPDAEHVVRYSRTELQRDSLQATLQFLILWMIVLAPEVDLSSLGRYWSRIFCGAGPAIVQGLMYAVFVIRFGADGNKRR